MGIYCHFSTSFRSANPNFRLRPKLGVKLVFGLSEKTRRKTNPKSEVAHCDKPNLWSLNWSVELSRVTEITEQLHKKSPVCCHLSS